MNGCFFYVTFKPLLRQNLSWFLSYHSPVPRIFKIILRLRGRHVFMWQSVKVLNVFNILTLIQTFWKTKTFFKKLEYSFPVETTKSENTSFPFKTALSEANVKINRMATTKWTYHKEWSFASNYFIFLENLFQF